MRVLKPLPIVLLIPAPVLAQSNGTYLIEVSGIASPSSPAVHVEMVSGCA